MIIPILILVSSIFFIRKFLNLKLFNSTKNPFLSSLESSLHPISSPKKDPTTTMSNKDDDLKRVFASFDKNRDGFITKEELKESLNNMGIIVSLKDIEEMVENLDSNKDGLIDIGEFREVYELLKELKEKEIEKENKVGEFDDDDEEYLKEAFSVFDGNKDGLITVEELGLVLTSLGLKEGNREDDCKEMIKKVDVDGDGMVNFDEFKMMMRARCSSSSKLVHGF